MAENHHSDSKPPSASHSRPAWRRLDWTPLLLLLLAVSFYWKLTLTDQYVWFDHPDMAYLEIPRLQFQASQIHKGRFPLWDPHLWSGQPLIGQTQPGPLFPLNLIFYLMPLKDGYIRFSHLNWYWALLHWLAALFAYCLARDLGLSKAAGVAAGVAFGFGGFVGSVAWLDVINGAIWAPLIFLFLFRSLRGDRPLRTASLGGLVLGVAWLSGHHELPILLSLASGFVWLWGVLRARERTMLLAAGALFFLVAGLIGAAQIIPTFEFGRQSLRWVGIERAMEWKDRIPYTVHAIYSLPPKGVLATVVAGLGRFADASPYMGIVAVALAALGVAARWKETAVRIALAIVCGALVYAMGIFAPLQGLFYSLLPVVDKARVPSRAVVLVNCGLALLAAYGLDAILTDTLAAGTRRLRQVLTAAGAFILTLCIGLMVGGKNVDDVTVLGGLVCLSMAGLLAAWQGSAISRWTVAAALIALCLLELTNAGPALYMNRNEKEAGKFTGALTKHRDLALYLRSLKQGPLRVVVDDQVIGANFGDWHGIDMLQGYMAGVSANLTAHELHTKRTQDLFGVTHFIGLKPDRPEQQEVFTAESGVKVFRSPDALPRARAVHEARIVDNDAWLRMGIQDANNDLRRTAFFLRQEPQLEQCAGEDQVELTSHGTDRIRIKARMACRGLVILSETMFPGWEAKVDGKPAPMWSAYGVFRSVVVEAGEHQIEMRYRPRSVYAGAGLCLLGLILVAVLNRNRE